MAAASEPLAHVARHIAEARGCVRAVGDPGDVEAAHRRALIAGGRASLNVIRRSREYVRQVTWPPGSSWPIFATANVACQRDRAYRFARAPLRLLSGAGTRRTRGARLRAASVFARPGLVARAGRLGIG